MALSDQKKNSPSLTAHHVGGVLDHAVRSTRRMSRVPPIAGAAGRRVRVSILFSSRIALLVERRMTTLGWPGAHVHWDTQENHKQRTVAAGTEWQLPRPPCHSYTQGYHAVLAYIACVAPAGNVGKGVKKAAAAVGRRLSACSDSAKLVEGKQDRGGRTGRGKELVGLTSLPGRSGASSHSCSTRCCPHSAQSILSVQWLRM